MAIRYNKLWKKLIDENMMKVDLRDQAGITTNALAKLGKNEHVSTQVLEKVCKVLHCEIQDIMEFVPDEEREVFTSEFAKKMQSGCAKGHGEKGKSRFWDSGSGKRLA